ncbi:RNA 2',3'-cyclic phosphodiesterase [Nanoarchaeota archaeon]|nr:MAG: RNA 2',3'-cyclic phosphodiesterase [Nanoarchaeota archaeon]
MVRCFLAVDLVENLRKDILRIQEALKGTADIKFVEEENLHLTLWFFGEISKEQVKLITTKVKEGVRNFKPFELELKRLGVFPNPSYVRVIWIGAENESLRKLYQRIKERLKEIGFREEREFHPHLTIGRVRRVLNREKLLSKLKELEEVEIGKMEVREIKLKKSTLTNRGPIYEDLEVFELG